LTIKIITNSTIKIIKIKKNDKGDFDDIDDILSGMSTPKSSIPPPPEIKKDRPVTQRVSIAYKNDFDDIDALISGINNDKNDFGVSTFGNTTMGTTTMGTTTNITPHTTIQGSVTLSNTNNNLDDIDDILADLSINNKTSFSTTPSNKQSVQVRSSTTADLNAIDDLLADLTF